MRDISEYKLLGNYLVRMYEKYGIDSIKYETAKSFTTNIFRNNSSISAGYNLLPMDSKLSTIRNMISKGVFRANLGNKIFPFKQVYPYEVAKGINVGYGTDKNLVFKILAESEPERDKKINALKEMYCMDIGNDIKSAIDKVIADYKSNIQGKGKGR